MINTLQSYVLVYLCKLSSNAWRPNTLKICACQEPRGETSSTTTDQLVMNLMAQRPFVLCHYKSTRLQQTPFHPPTLHHLLTNQNSLPDSLPAKPGTKQL